MEASQQHSLLLGPDSTVSHSDLASIARGQARIILSESLLNRLSAAADQVTDLIEKQVPIYGLTTGFGPLADAGDFTGHALELQTNLIYHLASGVGPLLSWEEARGLLAARLVVLSKGASGVFPVAVERCVQALNAGLAPVIPSQGTVGASGDLTPSAHLALSLLGQGDWLTRAGERISPSTAETEYGLIPLEMNGRLGLALVNGTSAMTGIAALAASRSESLFALALRSAVAASECMAGHSEAYHTRLSDLRPHTGQAEVTATIQQYLADSDWITPSDRRVSGVETPNTRLQDPYSLRCLPQIFGAIQDFMTHALSVIDTEVNSVTDNPVLAADGSDMIHGGNFYGQHIAFAADQMSLCLVKLAVLLDRQIDLMCDPARNGGLPKFLCRGKPGLESGLMGAQVTASALVAEMRSNLGHVSVLGIPTNGNNQDVNSMGTVAIRQTQKALDNLEQVLAIHLMTVAQAYDCRALNSDPKQSSESLQSLVSTVREFVEPLLADRPLSEDISRLSKVLGRIPDPVPGV